MRPALLFLLLLLTAVVAIACADRTPVGHFDIYRSGGGLPDSHPHASDVTIGRLRRAAWVLPALGLILTVGGQMAGTASHTPDPEERMVWAIARRGWIRRAC